MEGQAAREVSLLARTARMIIEASSARAALFLMDGSAACLGSDRS